MSNPHEHPLAELGVTRESGAPDLSPELARRIGGREVLRVDLGRVASKYIGETEKNLKRLFAAAEKSGAVLLIDEADALLGKRTEVGDAHDRYANVEVGYLVQQAEAHGGVVMLATNMKSALDPAFKRRIRFIVDFGKPTA